MLQTAVQEVPGSIPGSGKFMFALLFVVVVILLFCPKNTLFTGNFAIPFAMLIYFVDLTHCNICD